MTLIRRDELPLALAALTLVLLPFVLIFMILLINKHDLMREWTNSRGFNLVAWITVVVMIGLTLVRAMVVAASRALDSRLTRRSRVYG